MFLKRFGSAIPVGAMSADTIVVHFDVLENRLTHDRSAGKPFAVDRLHLEGVEKALGTRIVIAITPGAHAAYQPMAGQKRLILPATVLAATIRVHHHCLRHATLQGHAQGIDHQLGIHALAHGPANHQA